MKIHREDVLHVAELAHLDLSEEEIQMYCQQLDAILSYVDKLNELDTAGVEPMAQSLASSTDNAALRDDSPEGANLGDAVLTQAPDPAKPYFRVPKVIER